MFQLQIKHFYSPQNKIFTFSVVSTACVPLAKEREKKTETLDSPKEMQALSLRV
jgi:hypothetical protein